MEPTRRGVLAFAAVGLSDVLGGCFGGSQKETPKPSGGGKKKTPTKTPTATATPTATPEPGADVEYPALAEQTEKIWNELDWFATEYGAAINEFKRRVNTLRLYVDELDPSAGIDMPQVEEIRERAAVVATHVNDKLASHFDVDAALRTGNNVYVKNLRRAVERNDREDQRGALERLRLFYQSVVSEGYISNELSKQPVYDTLYDHLSKPKSGSHIFGLLYPDAGYHSFAHPDLDESTAEDGVDQHSHEFSSGHVVYAHAHKHDQTHSLDGHDNEPSDRRLYAYKDGGVAILKDTKLWRKRLTDFEPVYEDIFQPVRLTERQSGAYVTAKKADRAFDALPLYIQRFGSSEAASEARQKLLDGPVTADGTQTLAGRPWNRIYYRLGEATMYAYLLRAGRSLVVAVPSPKTWEQRPEHLDRLESTWLGVPKPDEKKSK